MGEIENNTFSRLLRISNIHSVNTTDTITDFTVNLNRMTETNNIIRAVVKSVSFPNNAYNIYTSGPQKNNVFNYDLSGVGPYSITIEQSGFYTTQQLINIIRPQIQADVDIIDPTNILTMEIGDYSKKIQYSLTKVTAQLVIPGIQGDGGLNSILGITSNVIVNQLGVTVSQQVPNLYGLTNVYLHSTTIGEGNLVDGDVENHDIVSEIPINAGYGQMVYYESQDDELDAVNYLSFRNYDNIKLTLRDLRDNIIELNGGDFVVVLKIYYI